MKTAQLLFVGLFAIFGLVALLHSGVTGNGVRGGSMSVQVLPTCQNKGCAYGDSMTLKTMAGYVGLSAGDLTYDSCHVPQRVGCLPERTTLYPIAMKGAPVNGVLYCNNHAWIFTAGLVPPCPPEIGDLSVG